MNLKEMESEISRLKAEAESRASSLKAMESQDTAQKSQIEKLSTDNATFSAKVAELEKQLSSRGEELATAKAEVEKLTSSLKVANESASRKVLQILAESGTPAIEGVSTSEAKKTSDDLYKEFSSITDPKARAAFYSKHRKELVG